MALVVLVCGGRDFADRRAVFLALDKLHALNGITKVIHGGATGADRLGRRWAKSRGIPHKGYPVPPAQWLVLGKAAGPLRNQRMLDKSKPDCVVAFPGGRGTADMIRRAQRARVLVIPSEVLV
jgi:hypothetical protein